MVTFGKNMTLVYPKVTRSVSYTDPVKYLKEKVDDRYNGISMNALRCKQEILEFVEKGVPKVNFPQNDGSRLCMPHKDGYLQESDHAAFEYKKDTYNLFAANGLGDTKILSQNVFQKPYYGDSLPMESRSYKEDFSSEDYDAFQKFLQWFILYNYEKSSWDDVLWSMKPHTTTGGSRIRPDGTMFNPADYAIEFAGYSSQFARARYGHHYKKEKEKICNMMLSDLIKPLVDKWHASSFNQFLDDLAVYVRYGIVGIGRQGIRGNQVDAATNFKPSETYTNQVLITKEREYNIPLSPGEDNFVSGKLDSARYINDIKNQLKYPFMWRNLRQILNLSFSANCLDLGGFKRAVIFIEDSKYGMLSTRPNVIDRRVRFCEAAKRKQNRIKMRMDTKNSDKFINSNRMLLFNLFPSSWRDFFMKKMTAIQVLPTGVYLVSGVNSGSSSTTFGNIVMGFRRVFTCIRDYLHCSIKDVTDAYKLMVQEYADYMILNIRDKEYLLWLPLGTDDQVVEIASDATLEEDNTMQYGSLSLSFNKDDEREFFGMRLTADGIKIDAQSMVSKTGFHENCSLYFGDVFADYARYLLLLQELGSGLANDWLKIYTRYTGLTKTDLVASEGKFFGLLKLIGVNLDETINIYSPKERLIYGVALNVKDFEESNKVDFKTVERFGELAGWNNIVRR